MISAKELQNILSFAFLEKYTWDQGKLGAPAKK
jgi:hypothetical protein